MNSIALHRISKRFGNVQALDEVSLEANDGEIVAIVGPSEAGKSTTLAVAAGLEKPDDGEVYVGGAPASGVRTWQRDVAVVFESYVLYPHLSVAENIAFPLRGRRRTEELAREGVASRVRWAAKLVEIDMLLERSPAELSGGQRQRVALARALARKPRLFLFDEPIAHLDAKLRHWLRGEIRRVLHEQAAPTIWATPDGIEAMAVADEIVVIKEGVVLQCGEPRRIFEHPESADVGALFGNPPMNLIPGTIDLSAGSVAIAGAERTGVPLRIESREISHDGRRDVLLGLRPGDCRLCEGGENVLVGKVLVIEPGANRTLVTVDVDGSFLQISDSRKFQVEIGDLVGVDVSGARIHVFDVEGVRARKGEVRLAASAVFS